jgi:hypothetical protein
VLCLATSEAVNFTFVETDEVDTLLDDDEFEVF